MMIISKNNKKLYIINKLVFILILFAMFLINTKVYASTISFESHDGSAVNSITKDIDDEMGDLPKSTRDGYIFDGWYKESTYQNKVSKKTVVTGDMTLHAKWVEAQFPFVYGPYRGEFECTGSNYIDTGVKLYNGDTPTEEGNWNKDYEIAFTIDEYDPSEQPYDQSVLLNTKYENANLKWPGLVFRKASNRLELTQSINMGQKVQKYTSDFIEVPYRVKILRISGKVYYEFNYGTRSFLQDMNSFNQQFDITTYFCAGDDGSGGIQRYAKTKISDYYIKLGTYEDDVPRFVTYPDGTVNVHYNNEIIDIGTNDEIKPSDNIATVTFKYHNGTSDTTSNVVKNYINKGFTINDVHYDDEATLVIDEDKVIEYNYDEEIVAAEFPVDPTKEYHTFKGWFDDAIDGTEYTSYDGVNDITIHAQYDHNMVTITTPYGSLDVPAGDDYRLPTNSVDKSSENVAEVTFNKHNGEENIIRYVSKDFTPNGWLINNTHYNNSVIINPAEDIELVPDYTETIVPVEFPVDPTKTYNTFKGWYTEETGGTEISSYNEENDIVIHAQYNHNMVTITTPDGDIEVPAGEDYELPTNTVEKAAENISEVTFKQHNGEEDIIKHVTKEFTPNGWLINGTHYDNEEIINPIENLELVPDYIDNIAPVDFPTNPEKDNHVFIGWFNQEIDGTKYTSYDGTNDLVLHAQYRLEYPTDITIDSDNITIVVGETHQVLVTFIPVESEDIITYTGFDNEKVSVTAEGLITGLSKGETTITVGLENVPNVTKTITVTVLSDKIESDTYEVRDKEFLDDDYRIVIGAEEGTLISDFKNNFSNDIAQIKIYEQDGLEVLEEDRVKTGLIIRLEYNGIVLDEATMVVRGDVDGDSYVNATDYITVLNHALDVYTIDDYIQFAAGDVEEDEILNATDYIKIMDFAIDNINSLNN